MATYSALPLDDVLHAFAMAKPIPDPETLEKFTRDYPDYAEALTAFAVELLLDSAIEEIDVDETGDEDAVSPAVSRAMSAFQNAVYQYEKESPSLQAVPKAKNPFSKLDRTEFRSVARSLHANTTFLMKLRDRTIVPDTIISRPRFCGRVAEEVSEPLDVIIAHFKEPQGLPQAQHFKADEKPALAKQETFEDAVRNSGLSEEQQAYLLKLE